MCVLSGMIRHFGIKYDVSIEKIALTMMINQNEPIGGTWQQSMFVKKSNMVRFHSLYRHDYS